VQEPVVVVVVAYNSADVVGGLLDSLPTGLAGTPAEVVVVDNGSTDDTVAVVSERSDCRVVRAENLGYAAGINRGVREALSNGPILVLNPDVRLRAGAVPALVRALGLPRTGVAAPRVLAPDGSLAPSLRREPTLARALGLGRTGWPVLTEYVTDPAHYEEPRVVDWALGAVLLVSRACHDRLGGWDESFFLYSEETDLCLRARDVGLVTRYVPSAVAEHIGGTSGRSHRTHAMQIVNRVRLYTRRHSRPAAWAYYTLTIVSELSWALRRHPQSWSAIAALLRPRRRPDELGLGNGQLPV
jgi:N-acetylglucosaminyl-diphospho-decaprenol L-rhamnosyltransferase